MSVFCDVDVFVLIFDKHEDKCTHYSSDPDKNLLSFFNEKCDREFYTNQDYLKFGGMKRYFPQVLAKSGD